MSFSAHFPVPVPQRDSDQLAPLPWPSASTSLGTSVPSDLARVSTSKFAHMHAHSSRLFMVLAIWPLPIAPTWMILRPNARRAGVARSTQRCSPPT
jgi:hypothetical protein